MSKHRDNPFFETSSLLELKELLNELTDKEVAELDSFISLRDGCCGEYMQVTLGSIRFHQYKDGASLEFISEDPIPGYETCIQAGGTRKRAEERNKKKES